MILYTVTMDDCSVIDCKLWSLTIVFGRVFFLSTLSRLNPRSFSRLKFESNFCYFSLVNTGGYPVRYCLFSSCKYFFSLLFLLSPKTSN